MPLHDWTRVPAGLFHHFHQDWSIEIARALNRGRLPKGLSALVEQRMGANEADVLTIEQRSSRRQDEPVEGGVATLERPVASIIRRSSRETYSRRANRIVVRHHLGRIVAVIAIVSPGNKDSRSALREFVDKAVALLRDGVHLLVVDLFPPSPRDPFGIHKAIWDEFEEEPFELAPGRDRILVSYEAGGERTAFVEPVGVGDRLPDMPLFLVGGAHVKTPLEATYQTAWEASPEDFRQAVESGVVPDPEAE